MTKVRRFQDKDYETIKNLYLQSELYGGEFSEERDSLEKIKKVLAHDPDSVLIYEDDGKILGTISLFENGRFAWLYRFAVVKSDYEKKITQALYVEATNILRKRGHNEILVYSPINDIRLAQRYLDLNMVEGGKYTCFWKNWSET